MSDSAACMHAATVSAQHAFSDSIRQCSMHAVTVSAQHAYSDSVRQRSMHAASTGMEKRNWVEEAF